MDIHTSTERLARDLRRLRNDLEASLRPHARRIDGELAQQYERLLDRMDELQYQLGKAQREALHRARELGHAAEATVRRHPWPAIGVAVAVGVVVGAVLAGGRR